MKAEQKDGLELPVYAVICGQAHVKLRWRFLQGGSVTLVDFIAVYATYSVGNLYSIAVLRLWTLPTSVLGP